MLPIASETGVCLVLQVFSYDVEKNNILKMFWQIDLTFELPSPERIKKTVPRSFWEEIVQLSFYVADFILGS